MTLTYPRLEEGPFVHIAAIISMLTIKTARPYTCLYMPIHAPKPHLTGRLIITPTDTTYIIAIVAIYNQAQAQLITLV